jgi:mono/diheme cytochrome c family protein
MAWRGWTLKGKRVGSTASAVRIGKAGAAARTILIAAAFGTGGCSKEARDIGPAVPQTRPASASDPRISLYQDNFYQVAQGGRYFAWYSCQGCHGEQAEGVRNLTDGRWRNGGNFDQLFASIADRHGGLAYGARMPVEILWQITAFVADQPLHTPEKRHRQAVDQQAEPVGARWSGPQ